MNKNRKNWDEIITSILDNKNNEEAEVSFYKVDGNLMCSLNESIYDPYHDRYNYGSLHVGGGHTPEEALIRLVSELPAVKR